MSVSFNKNENYVTMVVKYTEINKENSEEIINDVTGLIKKGSHNFIFIANKIENINPELATLLKKLNDLVMDNTGAFIVAKPKEDLEVMMEEMGIITTPTLDEAIDYIYMEDIEKDLGTNEIDDEDLENWI